MTQQQQHQDTTITFVNQQQHSPCAYATFSSSSFHSHESTAASGSVKSTGLSSRSCWDRLLSTYLGPRLVLMTTAAIYGTNFPLGAIMDEQLPPSAATLGRMTVAALVLSPFLQKLDRRNNLWPAILCGMCSGTAYIVQSIALVNTNPARVSFLGATTVLFVPILEGFIDHRNLHPKRAPETWLAALLTLMGVGILELLKPHHHHPIAEQQQQVDNNMDETTVFSGPMLGDMLALIQAVGFGTTVFISQKILRTNPHQALPVTAVIITTTAFMALLWSLWDGWMFENGDNDDWWRYTLPGMLVTPSYHLVAGAVLWTGVISTSLNYSLELMAIGYVPASEAAVIVASEPLWAALFAVVLYQSDVSASLAVGGLLIVAACVINATLTPEHFGWFSTTDAAPAAAQDDKDEESEEALDMEGCEKTPLLPISI